MLGTEDARIRGFWEERMLETEDAGDGGWWGQDAGDRG